MRFGPALATVVLPGFGQAAAGRTIRGVVWASASVVVLAAVLWLPIVAIAALVVHVASAIDAYVCLRRAENPDWKSHAAFAVGLLALSPCGIGALFFHAYKIPSSGMNPTIEIGDHVLVESLTTQVLEIHRGDLITFTYPCSPDREYIKRVIAVGGDTVEVRCSVVYINGKAIDDQLVAAETTYDDYDESAGRWFPRSASRYREHLGAHAFDIYDSTDRPAGHETQRDFPRHDRPPSCADTGEGRDGASDRGKLVVTAPEDPDKPCALHAHYVVPEHALFTMGDNRYNSNDSRVWGAVDDGLVKGRVRWIWWSRHLSRVGGVE